MKQLAKHLLFVAALALPLAACDKPDNYEYILTGSKPGLLHAIDTREHEIARTYQVPGAEGGIYTITPSADRNVAYVMIDGMRAITGIDLNTGAQVFRAEFPYGEMRYQGFFAMDVSPDGSELFVYRMRTRVQSSEYEVLQPEIAVYRTDAGLEAEPVRTFEAPRRIHLLMAAGDGKSIYAMGFDIVRLDVQSGQVLETIPLSGWSLENASVPDILDFWPQWEQTGVFSTPLYYVDTSKSPDDPSAYKTALLTLDLNSGEHAIHAAEDTSVLMFSSVISPADRNLAFATYTQLSKFDLSGGGLVGRIDLDHTYYAINISDDGEQVFVGGAACDIGFYDAATLEKDEQLFLPAPCGDQSTAAFRVITRKEPIPPAG